MNVLVALEAHGLCGHLCVGGIRALTDLRLAALHGNGAVQIQLHPVGGRLQRDGIHAGVVPEGRRADAPADRAGVLGEFRLAAVIVHGVSALFQASPEGVEIVGIAGEGVVIILGHDELHAVFQRVHAHGGGTFVDVGLVSKAGLGHTVATHGARRGPVGKHGPAVTFHVVAGVDLGEGTQSLGADGVTVGGVGSLIGEALHLPGGQLAVLPEPGDDMEPDSMTDAVGNESLLPGAVDPDTAAVDLRGAPGAKGLIQGILLIAEAAADIGLDDLNIRPRAAQGLPHDPADDMGDLGGADHHYPAVFLVSVAAVVLNVAVLDRGGLIPALHFNQTRLLNGGGIVALADVRVLEDISGIILMDLRRIRLHGLLNVQHEGQFLVLHLQRPDALHGRHLVLRDDHGHIVAVVADMAVQQVAVRHILMTGVHGPGVARRGKGNIRYVKAGQHLHHAVDGLRRRRIHGLHEAVGDLRVLDPDVQSTGRHPVLVVFCAPGHLIKGIHTGHAFSYCYAHGASLLLSLILTDRV